MYTKKIIKHLPIFYIDTNLTILTEKMINFFKRNDIRIAVSLDGPKEIHDKARIFRGGLGSFTIVNKNLRKLLKEVNSENITITPVYTPYHLISNFSMVDLYKFFMNEYGIFNIDILPITKLGLGESFLSEFGKDIIEEYTNKIRNYAYELGKYLVEHCTAGLNIVDLMPNGDVFHVIW